MKRSFFNVISVPSSNEIEKERRWVKTEVKRIGEQKLNKLIAAAIKTRLRAYKPYSGYAVGAAVLCSSGKIYSAPNTEVVTSLRILLPFGFSPTHLGK